MNRFGTSKPKFTEIRKPLIRAAYWQKPKNFCALIKGFYYGVYMATEDKKNLMKKLVEDFELRHNVLLSKYNIDNDMSRQLLIDKMAYQFFTSEKLESARKKLLDSSFTSLHEKIDIAIRGWIVCENATWQLRCSLANLEREISGVKGDKIIIPKHDLLPRSSRETFARQIISRIEIDEQNEYLQSLRQVREYTDKRLFESCLNEIKKIYGFSRDDTKLLANFLTQVKRSILGEKRSYPYMLCFYNNIQGNGKSVLASILYRVINKVDLATPLSVEDVTGSFTPDDLGVKPLIWFDEFGSSNKDKADYIKSLITNDGYILKKKKYQDDRKIPNLSNFILSTNRDPTGFFFTDNKNRRLGIIHDFAFRIKKSEEELFNLISLLWGNTPLEYIFDPVEIYEYNLNSSLADNGVFDLFFEWFGKYGHVGFFKHREYFTLRQVQKIDLELNNSKFTINCNALKNYIETNPDYFVVHKYRNSTRYQFTQDFIAELEHGGEVEKPAQKDDKPFYPDVPEYTEILEEREEEQRQQEEEHKKAVEEYEALIAEQKKQKKEAELQERYEHLDPWAQAFFKPIDSITAMHTAYEAFLSLREAGFSKKEVVQLVNENVQSPCAIYGDLNRVWPKIDTVDV
jgi:hypothetical protein